jgi:hypothetical protein
MKRATQVVKLSLNAGKMLIATAKGPSMTRILEYRICRKKMKYVAILNSIFREA